MIGKKSASPVGRSERPKREGADMLHQQFKDTKNPRFTQFQDNPEAYRRAVHRMLGDLYVMSRDWPSIEGLVQLQINRCAYLRREGGAR